MFFHMTQFHLLISLQCLPGISFAIHMPRLLLPFLSHPRNFAYLLLPSYWSFSTSSHSVKYSTAFHPFCLNKKKRFLTLTYKHFIKFELVSERIPFTMFHPFVFGKFGESTVFSYLCEFKCLNLSHFFKSKLV